MNQQIYFKFILQYLEFSSKFDQQQYELSIMLKRGALAAQTIISKMQIRNPERPSSNMCRLPIDKITEFQQKMINKDGVYLDSNIKFLIYLGGNQLGDCQINLSYFLNGKIDQDQKVKQPLTSTTDKRAALLFRVVRQQHQSQFETQEYPQINVPVPVPTNTITHQQVPQTARNANSRKMEFPTKTTRARSQSPPKEFKSVTLVTETEEQTRTTSSNQPSDNLTQKFLQLGEKFSQEKLQQIVPPIEDNDNFKEITEMITQQEEEIQKQIEQLDQHIKIDSKIYKPQVENAFTFGKKEDKNQELQSLKEKYEELEQKYNRAQDEHQHLKRIIRQSGEQLKKQSQLTQSGYKQSSDNALNQSTISNQEQFERTIEKKNQIIKDLSNQILELEKNTKATVIEQLKNQITRLEQQLLEKQDTWQAQEKIYKEKIIKLLQNTE